MSLQLIEVEENLNRAIESLNDKIRAMPAEATLRIKSIEIAERTFKNDEGENGVEVGDINVFLSYANRIYKYITEGKTDEEA
jgi:hypothetical protein